MKLGFTGTRNGMTEKQRNKVKTFLKVNRTEISRAAHGDCVGADAEFDSLVGIYVEMEIFPSENSSMRAYCDAPVIHPPKPPLERNHDIVDWCDVLLATPKESKEVLRSGTWATIRYARKVGKPIYIIDPDGGITYVGQTGRVSGKIRI